MTLIRTSVLSTRMFEWRDGRVGSADGDFREDPIADQAKQVVADVHVLHVGGAGG